MDETTKHRPNILHFLAKLKSGFRTSSVRMGCRSDLRKLLIKLQHMENVSVEVKQSACQLLEDLQAYLANSRIGILKAQREAVRVFLETLEIGICGRVPLPIDLFEAIQIATKAELPKGMPRSIFGANRCVTVYVDPEHGEFTSVEVIRDSLCRYLHEHARGLERNESVEVKTAEGGNPMTDFRHERFAVSGTSVGRCSRTDQVSDAGLRQPFTIRL